MWREFIILLFWVSLSSGCLEGFYGPACLVCPPDSFCNGTTRRPCAAGLRSLAGSRDCYNSSVAMPVEVNRRVPVVSWSGLPSPYTGTESCGCFRTVLDASVVLDAGSLMWVGGVATASLEGAWVRSFFVAWSADNVTWSPVGGLYSGNVDDVSVKDSVFPYPVRARYLRVSVVDYFLWPSFRGALLHANVTVAAVPTTFPASTTRDVNTTTEPIFSWIGTTSAFTDTNSNLLSSTSVVDTSSLHVSTTAFSTTTHWASTPAPGTDTALRTTTAPTVTTAVPVRCGLRVNMVVALLNGTCVYGCKVGTYNHSGRCVGQPRASMLAKGTSVLNVGWQWKRPWSRLHDFNGVWALETMDMLASDLAVKVDQGPWMAWSKRHWTPHLNTSFGTEVSSMSQWLLLPWAVNHSLRVRAFLPRGIVEYAHGRWTKHGSTRALHVRGDVEVKWGMSASGPYGDSQSVCSVKCVGGTIHHVAVLNHAHTIFNTRDACINVSDGLVWLRNSTELHGVDVLLTGFIGAECRRGTEAWVVPQGDRSVLWAPEVQVVCRAS